MDFMSYALEIAARAKGTCKPNPAVGAVIVRGDRIVGEGITQPAGSAHAEIVAIEQAGEAARGAVLYVTLEPCSHHGRTAPCVDAVIRAGIVEVHVAMVDSSPWVAGRGLEALQRAGVNVALGERAEEARRLNLPYFTWVERGRPYVTGVYGRDSSGRAIPMDWRRTGQPTEVEIGTPTPGELDVIVVDQDWHSVDLAPEWTVHVGDEASSTVPGSIGLVTVTLTADAAAGVSVDAWHQLLSLLAERRMQHVVLDAPPATLEALRRAGLVDRVLEQPQLQSVGGDAGGGRSRRPDRISAGERPASVPGGGRLTCSPGS